MTVVDNVQSLLKFGFSRRVPFVHQAEVAECGLACLAMVSSYHGLQIDLPGLRQRFSANLKGLSLRQLMQAADDLQLTTRALQCPLEQLQELRCPAVLHWDLNHFVVLVSANSHTVKIHDPSRGERELKLAEVGKHYTGVALELTPSSGFKKQDLRQRLGIHQLWSRLDGLPGALTTLLGISVCLQLFALASPYFMQTVVDSVLLTQDRSMLVVLAMGFGLLLLISSLTSVLRSWLVIRMAATLNIHMGANLLRHLLKLPMTFFEQRHVGDIVSRFGSLGSVRERITTGVVETVVDGMMSIAVLVMMLIYSVKLTMVVLGFVLVFLIMRLVTYPLLRRLTEEEIQAGAKEQSHFLENIRGIQTIKLFACESERQGIWQNLFADVINIGIRSSRLRIAIDFANTLLFGLENILVIYVAAQMVMAGEFSVGMLMAFMSYKGQLTSRIASFIEQILQFRMLRLHLERLADIALHEQEESQEGFTSGHEINGGLQLQGVSYRYGPDSGLVVKPLNLSVEPGECLAITGPSGVGKTTLLKIMLGLLKPTTGKVLLDGHELGQIGLRSYRQQVATVMQEDTLLSGSVADNISFFDPEPNHLRIQQCAQLASIHQDVMSLPMAYESLVGDMGNQFSGGQVQRLLLARALYKQPKILFLDEATSHLDLGNESRVFEQVKALPMTRIIIAHRKETLQYADRVIDIRDLYAEGAVTELGGPSGLAVASSTSYAPS